MDKAHRLNYWLIASIVVLNLLLQGCSTIIANHDLSRDTRGIRTIDQDLKELIEQKLTSAGWEVVDFYNGKNGLKVKAKVVPQAHLLVLPLLYTTACGTLLRKQVFISSSFYVARPRGAILWGVNQTIAKGKHGTFKSTPIFKYHKNVYPLVQRIRINLARLFSGQYSQEKIVQSSFQLPKGVYVGLGIMGISGIDLVAKEESGVQDQKVEEASVYEKENDQEFSYPSSVKFRLYSPLENLQKEPAIDSTSYQTYQEALECLPTNDPKKKRIDLRREKLTKPDLEALKEAIAKNFIVGYIYWGKLPAGCQQLKEQIEKKLVKNICEYTYHPNDYVHGLLAMNVYNDLQEGQQVDLNALTKQLGHELPSNTTNINWKVVQVENDSYGSGFYSALYVNENSHQAVLAFRGSKMGSLKDVLSRRSGIQEIIEGVLGHSTMRWEVLTHAATKAAVKYTKKNGFNLSITGHSLGGYLAELGVAFCYQDLNCTVKGIVFDSPGAGKRLDSFKPGVINPGTKVEIGHLPITTYLTAPNILNICNKHPGEVYRINSKLKQSDWTDKTFKIVGRLPLGIDIIKVIEKQALAFTSNSIFVILKHFDPSTGKPKEYVRVADWPQLNTDAIKYVGKEGALGAIVGASIGGGIGAAVGGNLKGRVVPSIKITIGGSVGGMIGSLVGVSIMKKFGVVGSVIGLLADLHNIGQEQHIATYKGLLGKDKKEHSLETQKQFILKYEGHYKESEINLVEQVMNLESFEHVDWYLNKLYKHRDSLNLLTTKDITVTVLKNILVDYEIVSISGCPCIRLTTTQKYVENLQDKMRRALEILSSSGIKKAIEDSKHARDEPSI